MNKKQFLEILNKHHLGTASAEEEEFLRTYYNLFELDEGLTDALTGAAQWELGKRIKNRVEEDIARQESNYRERALPGKWNLKWIAAAVIVLMTTIGLFLYKQNYTLDIPKESYVLNDVAPGGNKAVLTLANGSKISLTDAGNGELAKQSGLKIIKTKDGELVYEVVPGPLNEPISYNTIETPRGGQYQVNLPDGTKVWLNAASSLKFPATFTNALKRQVELTGEAYFEVSHVKGQPFIVATKGQEIEVLGTHFNVNAYSDEPVSITSLLEGSVKISHDEESRILMPGEQAEVQRHIKISKIDEGAIAWKNGLTSFRNAEIKTIMRQLSRWYDVDVKYAGEVPKELFNGDILRTANLSEVIKVIEFSGVRFKIEGRKITVMP